MNDQQRRELRDCIVELDFSVPRARERLTKLASALGVSAEDVATEKRRRSDKAIRQLRDR